MYKLHGGELSCFERFRKVPFFIAIGDRYLLNKYRASKVNGEISGYIRSLSTPVVSYLST